MVLSYLSTAEAAAIRGEFRRLEDTIKVTFWDVSYALWRKDRPAAAWDAGTAGERWIQVGAGIGRLRENGPAGLVAGEDLIFPDAGYVLRTEVTAFDVFRAPDSGNSEHDVGAAWLTIESRLFQVGGFKPRGGQRTHANAYLREVFDATLPGVAP